MGFDFSRISSDDREIARRYIGDLSRPQDVVICGEQGEEYLHRWHVIPRNPHANIYFHIQIASDPERPLHDHPWDNQTVILANGYDELYQGERPGSALGNRVRTLRVGDVQARLASEPHRLILPPHFPYTMTQFSTGPKFREWGFWIDGKWYSHDDCATTDPITNRSRFIYPKGTHR